MTQCLACNGSGINPSNPARGCDICNGFGVMAGPKMGTNPERYQKFVNDPIRIPLRELRRVFRERQGTVPEVAIRTKSGCVEIESDTRINRYPVYRNSPSHESRITAYSREQAVPRHYDSEGEQPDRTDTHDLTDSFLIGVIGAARALDEGRGLLSSLLDDKNEELIIAPDGMYLYVSGSKDLMGVRIHAYPTD